MDITRAVHGVTNHVNNTFGYSVTQDPSNPAIIDGFPTEFEIELDGNPDENGNVEMYGGPVLSDYEFTALGDYKFIVREVSSQDAVNYPVDSEKEYYFYVSVRNKLDNDGKPTGEYVATMAEQVRDHDTGDKMSAIFESSAQRSRIAVTNTVSGNLANVDDYFKYKVIINGANNGDEFTIYGQDELVNYGGATVATVNSLTIDDTDDYIYLKHGQTVYIGYDGENNELPIGLTYSLVEVDANGYVQYVDDVAGDTSETKTVNVDSDASSNKVDFLNHKEGNVLTGIIINTAPYVFAIGTVGTILAVVYVNKRKQRKTKCSK